MCVECVWVWVCGVCGGKPFSAQLRAQALLASLLTGLATKELGLMKLRKSKQRSLKGSLRGTVRIFGKFQQPLVCVLVLEVLDHDQFYQIQDSDVLRHVHVEELGSPKQEYLGSVCVPWRPQK